MNSSTTKVLDHCLVTVGTTKFDALIKEIDSNCDDFLQILSDSHKIKQLTIQKGRGKYLPHKLLQSDVQMKHGINVNVIEYTSTGAEFQLLLKKSCLIISHAGAGSILESLRLHKKLLVVVNENLMNNHQVDICQPLDKEQYLHYCNVQQLRENLREKNFKEFKVYPKADFDAFPHLLNQHMQFHID